MGIAKQPRSGVVLLILLLASAGLAALYSPDAPEAATAKSAIKPPPKAWTTEAYGVEGSLAVIAGVINPRGLPTVYRFKWGLTSSYGHFAPEVIEGRWYGNEPREMAEALNCLRPKTTYHYRIVAYSHKGKTFGGDLTFTTTPLHVSRNFAYGECPGGRPTD